MFNTRTRARNSRRTRKMLKRSHDGSNQSKAKFFFKNMSEHDADRMRFDEEALYSVTESETADRMTDALLALDGVNHNSTITDLTACVGGNTISFAKRFKHVNAVELNPGRFEMLKHNVAVAKLHNVDFFNGDALDVVHKTHQDLVFIDPPWGGPSYKDSADLSLKLGNVDVGTFACDLLQRKLASYVALKVPMNFAVDKLKKDAAAVNATVFEPVKRLRKMRMLVVHLL